jgi:trigger factor
MKVTNERVENRQAFLTVELEPVEMEASLEKAYRRIVQKTNVPGFRKGKAPRPIIERYIGKDKLYTEALDHLIPDAYEKSLKEAELEPYAQPLIEITQREPLIFKATVPLLPIIELGDYHGLQLTPDVAEVTDDDYNDTLEQIRHQYATWEPVERPVQLNDLAVIDVSSDTEGEPFLNRQGLQYHVLSERPFPAPGFAEQLAGLKTGEEKAFTLKFPSDFPQSGLADKEPSFRVKVHEVKEEKLPEITIDLIKQIAPDLETMDQFRERMMSNLGLRAEEKCRLAFEERVFDAVVDVSHIEFPPLLVDLEIDRILNQQARSLGMSLEDYVERLNKTKEQLREELAPQATKTVTKSLVLGKVAEAEEVKVSHDEVDAEIENLTKTGTGDKNTMERYLKSQQGHESVERMLLTRKTVDLLLRAANSGDTQGGTK